MSELVFLVLIETGSNQSFIFASNRMRENVGASELVRRVGFEWVPQALADMFPQAPPSARAGQKTATFVENLRKDAGQLEGRGYEIVVATSGKAMVLFKDPVQAQELIWQVTLKALEKAPGLAVRGAIAAFDPTGNRFAGAAASKQVHNALNDLKHRLWPASFRAPMAPVLEPCPSSGLPLQGFVSDRENAGKSVPVAAMTAAKDKARDDAYTRMREDLLQGVKKSYWDFDKDLDDTQWIAIVHADGNGFGKAFLTLETHLDAKDTAMDYLEALRNFSTSLELCSTTAFQKALEVFPPPPDGKPVAPPVVPLVIGGDDMTAACDGRHAINFTARYLREFETAASEASLAGQENFIPTITRKLQFGAGAGVAIVKPHFPFHRAYELAEALLKSAKTSKTRANTTAISALDYQVVFDDSASDIESMRHPLEKGDLLLHNRPYVVSSAARIEAIEKDYRPWAECRRFWNSDGGPSLMSCVAALALKPERDGEDKTTALPRSQQKAMQDALFLGREIADARWRVVCRAYEAKDKNKGFHWPGGLFFETEGKHVTQFLDALEVLDVIGPQELLAEPGAAA